MTKRDFRYEFRGLAELDGLRSVISTGAATQEQICRAIALEDQQEFMQRDEERRCRNAKAEALRSAKKKEIIV